MLKRLAIVALSVAACAAAQTQNRGGATNGVCANDEEFVGYPLKGWIGYTNTGQSVSEMTVEAFASLDKPLVASAKTDTTGRFSFPTLKPGKYYLKATKKLVGTRIDADGVVRVSKCANRIACLVAEGTADESSNR